MEKLKANLEKLSKKRSEPESVQSEIITEVNNVRKCKKRKLFHRNNYMHDEMPEQTEIVTKDVVDMVEPKDLQPSRPNARACKDWGVVDMVDRNKKAVHTAKSRKKSMARSTKVKKKLRFQCNVCEYATKRKLDLKRHETSHSPGNVIRYKYRKFNTLMLGLNNSLVELSELMELTNNKQILQLCCQKYKLCGQTLVELIQFEKKDTVLFEALKPSKQKMTDFGSELLTRMLSFENDNTEICDRGVMKPVIEAITNIVEYSVGRGKNFKAGIFFTHRFTPIASPRLFG